MCARPTRLWTLTLVLQCIVGSAQICDVTAPPRIVFYCHSFEKSQLHDMNDHAVSPDSRLRPPNGTRQRPPRFHPSWGGNSYSDDTRQMVIEKYLQGQDLNSPDIRDLRAEWKFPAMITCQRWIDIFTRPATSVRSGQRGTGILSAKSSVPPSRSSLSIASSSQRPPRLSAVLTSTIWIQRWIHILTLSFIAPRSF